MLLTLGKDQKYLGADIGFMSILHAFGQNLSDHSHLHCIVLGGGLTSDLKFKQSKDDFLFPVRVIAKLFRGKFRDAINKLHAKNKMVFPKEFKHLNDQIEFDKFRDSLYKKEWIPHIKAMFKGAANVMDYLGIYAPHCYIKF